MALSRERKAKQIEETAKSLEQSQLTVVARYGGTSVKAMQELRKQASDSGTAIKVIKNRLLKQAASRTDNLKDIDTDFLKGQLVYAFNSGDEVAPAQVLAGFAKDNPQIEFVAGITAEGEIISAEDVRALSALPTKEQLRAQLAGTIGSPLSSLASVLNAVPSGLLNALNSRAQQLES